MNSQNILGPVGGFFLALAVKLSPLDDIPFRWVLALMGVKTPALCWLAILNSYLDLATSCTPFDNPVGIVNLLTVIMFVAFMIIGWFGVRELIKN